MANVKEDGISDNVRQENAKSESLEHIVNTELDRIGQGGVWVW